MSFTSCLKVEEYPDEPIIEFLSIEQSSNALELNFSFTDGDGNFGLEDGDSLPPYDEDPFKQNLIVNYYELQDGEWRRFGNDLPLTSPYYIPGTFSQRVDWVKPTGQNQAQDGEVSYSIEFYYNPDTSYDTCRYEFFIYDRDLNESNTELTNYFIKP